MQFKPMLFKGQLYIRISFSLALLIWDTCCILLNKLNLNSVLPFFPCLMNRGQKVKQNKSEELSIKKFQLEEQQQDALHTFI